jgi:hypothetical protein
LMMRRAPNDLRIPACWIQASDLKWTARDDCAG